MHMLFEAASSWMRRNARPIDFARWQFHFEGGGKRAVIDALSAYQNADGGFGHALEPDAWSPGSSPAQMCAAIEILYQIGADAQCAGIIEGILRYLASGAHMRGEFWLASVPSINDYPHAQWMGYGEDPSPRLRYDPTACLAGFALAHADARSALAARADGIARGAIGALIGGKLACDSYELFRLCQLLRGIEMSPTAAAFDLDAFKDKLDGEIRRNLSAVSNLMPLLPQGDPCIEQRIRYLTDSVNSDGVWDISWRWAAYEREFAIAENWWRGIIAVENMLFLKRFGAVATI